MGLGILEPSTHVEHVAGTALLQENDSTPGRHSALKRGTGKDAHVVLVPQPSADPNDPLNWPIWQRDLLLVLYAYCTLTCVGGVGPLLSVIALPLIQEFHLTFTQISLLTGYNLLAVGVSGILVSAVARKFGKRPLFLVSISLVLAGTLWAGAAHSHESLIGGRVIQGLGMAMFESVTFAIIGDLYHVHQRGSRMAIYLLSQTGGANIPGIIAGVVATNMTWRWVFWLLAIFLGFGLLLAIPFGWETAFVRNELYNIDTSSKDNIEILDELKGASKQTEVAINQLSKETTISSGIIPPRKSFVARMALYSGTYTEESFLQMLLRPFVVLLNPAILWAVLAIAFAQLWIVVIAFIIVQLFSPPPYLLDTEQIGYITGGPLVGGILGCLVCGAISDPIIKFLSTRNNGVYEPEFRLVISGFVLVLAVPGLFLFGRESSEMKPPVVMSVLWGLTFAGTQFTANAISGYLVDAYRNSSVEIFIISMTIKNFLFFGFSYFLNDWIAKWGPQKAFDVIGGITLVWTVSAIPFYIYGKRLRSWWHNSALSRLLM